MFNERIREGHGGEDEGQDTTRHDTGAFLELLKLCHGNNNVPRLHAASLARTHERNEYDFLVGLTPPTCDIYIYTI